MTEQETLKRDIKTLKESIQMNWRDLADKPLSQDERHNLKEEVVWLTDELKELIERLERLDA